jgi:7-cyano-7-deazaguanine synthase
MKSLVLLSGGVDSAVSLAITNDPVEALTIDYGQRHNREIFAAQKIAAHYDVPWQLVNVDPVIFRGSALTNHAEVPDGHAESPDATYVPARNTVFLAVAAARAESIGANSIILGANADDAAGYPDCRAEYLWAYRDVLQQGTVGNIWISAPLLLNTKAEIMDMASELDVPIELTWSCYRGGENPCGTCGACVSRGDHVVPR